MYCATIIVIIDKRRREIVNGPLSHAKGEVSEMYYEGMRVAYQEMQDVIERYVQLEKKQASGQSVVLDDDLKRKLEALRKQEEEERRNK